MISQDTITEYLQYFASHMIILSEHIKKNKIKDKESKILKQYLDEMSENLQQIIILLDKEGDIYHGLEGEDPIKIIRDFKIDRIMNERNR